ncbi:MAG TPA: hypothetical protein VN958_05365 [Chitinophagaceae bacterium]|nr:hypothetical protein [Chitinophagaceae bacterium]
MLRSRNPTDFERNTALLEHVDFVTANCACTKKALEKIGGLDEDFTMAWREDSAFEFDLLENDITIIKVNEAIIVHPVRTAWGISIMEQKKACSIRCFIRNTQLFINKKFTSIMVLLPAEVR